MKPLDFLLLSDENIPPSVVSGLRARGFDVRSVGDEGLIGRPDREVLDRAAVQGRVVITHDLAFGQAGIRANAPFVGIVYLRPGHISSDFVLAVVDALHASAIDVQPPFIVVAERREVTVRVRIRTEPPW